MWLGLMLVCVVSLVVFVACGSKAKPDVPNLTIPAMVEGLSAVAKSGKLVLSWKAVAPTDPRPFAGYQVFRVSWAADAVIDPATGETLMMVEIPREEVEGKSVLSFTDTTIKDNSQYEYHVYAYSTSTTNDKLYGPDIKVGPFKARFPEDAVGSFTLNTTEGAVLLTWQPVGPVPLAPEGEAGKENPEVQKPKEGDCVMVYKAEGEEGPYLPEPINDEPLFDNQYSDHEVQPKLTYRYKARHAKLVKGVLLQGAFSKELKGNVVDNTAPPEPVVMWIKIIEGGVRLRWQPVDDLGLFGYMVERRLKTEGEEDYVDASVLITVDEYTDRKVEEKQEYVYRVMARDRAGNISYSQNQIIMYDPELLKPVEEPPVEAAPAETVPAEEPPAEATPAEEAAPELAPIEEPFALASVPFQ